MSRPTRALLIVPKFNPHSFWSYEGATGVMGVKYSAAPLGLITLAALLPRDWELRLVNRNTEALDEPDLAWADIVMTGGMLSQQFDALRLIEMCRSRGLPVAVGGPDVTSSPDIYRNASFMVLGEAEDTIGAFIAAWNAGERHGVFEAPKFKVDVTTSPIPRFDLLKFDQYLYIGVQFSRGCPFTCEFCDIIELYGRNPRAKTPAQMLLELDRLFALGYRGHLDFVDDNLIGNKKAVKAFLPHLVAWQKAHRYPFILTTEASLNIADDPALLDMMVEANFHGFFVGIESPDPVTLLQTSKKQNVKRDIATSIQRIYAHGMFVLPGLIVGFDSERQGTGAAIIRCIEEAPFPVAMVSLLYALPGTQLTRRLAKEGRLRNDIGLDTDRKQGDFTLAGLNFATLRPRKEVLEDFIDVLEHLYEPAGYFRRARRVVLPMRRPRLPFLAVVGEATREIDRFFRLMTDITLRRPDIRWRAWAFIVTCFLRNPRAVRNSVVMTVFIYYLRPLSRIWIAEARAQICAIETAERAQAAQTTTPGVIAKAG